MIDIPDRLPVETFEFPLAEIRRGYRSAIYFARTKRILDGGKAKATMQIFQKNHAVICGIDEVIALLKQCTGHWKDEETAHKLFDLYMQAKLTSRQNPLDINLATDVVKFEQALADEWVNTYNELSIEALYDGDPIVPWEPVMKIHGPYAEFAHLESVYLGILARATKVATNTANVVDAAGTKPVLFFADRFDRWSNQGSDGYAAHIGGASGVASDAMANWWGAHAMGTMPHALIAMVHGDVVAATRLFHDKFPETNLVALVDFNNDCVGDSLACAAEFGEKLWGVRLDTSENMVDRSIGARPDLMGDFKPTGVNVQLVQNVRNALDNAGHNHVKIVVSGGFNPEKIRQFQLAGAPVDSYAVGSSLLQGSFDFTADIVAPTAKAGRKSRDSANLEWVPKDEDVSLDI